MCRAGHSAERSSIWVFVCVCRRELIAYLRATAPAHLYATAMAPPAAQQILSALQLLRNDDGSGRGPAKIATLHANANFFRAGLQDLGCTVLGDWDSPVMVIPNPQGAAPGSSFSTNFFLSGSGESGERCTTAIGGSRVGG
jgi:hypothetical protein